MRFHASWSVAVVVVVSVLASGCEQQKRKTVDPGVSGQQAATGGGGNGSGGGSASGGGSGPGGTGGATPAGAGGASGSLAEACAAFCGIDDEAACEIPLCEAGCNAATECVSEQARLYDCYATQPQQLECEGNKGNFKVPVSACNAEEAALGECL